jgi:hypothetical protein
MTLANCAHHAPPSPASSNAAGPTAIQILSAMEDDIYAVRALGHVIVRISDSFDEKDEAMLTHLGCEIRKHIELIEARWVSACELVRPFSDAAKAAE